MPPSLPNYFGQTAHGAGRLTSRNIFWSTSDHISLITTPIFIVAGLIFGESRLIPRSRDPASSKTKQLGRFDGRYKKTAFRFSHKVERENPYFKVTCVSSVAAVNKGPRY